MSVSGPADDVAIRSTRSRHLPQRKRTPWKRARRLGKDGGECIAPVPSEEKYLSRLLPVEGNRHRPRSSPRACR